MKRKQIKKSFGLSVLMMALIVALGIATMTSYGGTESASRQVTTSQVYVATWGSDENSGTSADAPWRHCSMQQKTSSREPKSS